MASKKKANEPLESSYTLDPRQQTMLGLPTKAPEMVPAITQGPYADQRRRAVLDKYKTKPAPQEWMLFNEGGSAENDVSFDENSRAENDDGEERFDDEESFDDTDAEDEESFEPASERCTCGGQRRR